MAFAARCNLRPFCRLLTPSTHSAKYICTRHKSTGSSTSSEFISELPPPRLDYKEITENVQAKIRNAQVRNAPISEEDILAVARCYNDAKEISKELNSQRHLQSQSGERIRTANNEEERAKLRQEAASLKKRVQQLQASLQKAQQSCQQYALHLPNDTHPQVPPGPEPSATMLAIHGPEPAPVNPLRDHVAIAKHLDLLDLESGATVTGSSWYFLKREAALLEIALMNYSMSIAIKHGFIPVTTPDVIRSDIAIRCGFQPRDSSETPVSHMYHLTPNHQSAPQLILCGTAEIPLAGMFAGKIYPQSSLPLKFVGVGRAFRQEAGARSADTRGLYRVHQFTKVELFAVTAEHCSEDMMEELRNIQTEILQGLNLPFRILDMPTEELGASAYRKYDMEAWMPGRGSWGEVSSLSNCTDYQARRLHIRYRPQNRDQKEADLPLPFAHTLNGTAAAIPRLIVALIENGAILNESGEAKGLRLPQALQRFWPASPDGRIEIEWTDSC